MDVLRGAACCGVVALLLTLGCGGPSDPIPLFEAEQEAEAAAPLSDETDADLPPALEPISTVPVSTAPVSTVPVSAADASNKIAAVERSKKRPASEPASSRVTQASAVNERPIDLKFDDIKFDIEPGDVFERDQLPQKIEDLLGKRIRIRGYILPSYKQSGITQFVLVRDNLECCFGPGAALYDCIRVEMKPGKSTEFSVRPVTVEGVFELQEFFGPDDLHLAIYYMTGEDVR